MEQLIFVVIPGEYALCRLEANSPVPAWVWLAPFYSITKTANELSIVCEFENVPTGIKCNRGWRLLKIASVLDLNLTGITAKFSTVLANAHVNLCVIATFDTDYLLVPQQKLPIATMALQEAGFIVA
jgi:uncharacterized protein